MAGLDGVSIQAMLPDDWPTVRRIYLQGIATNNATFEQDAPEWEKWDRDRMKACRLVARGAEGVCGWAALSPVSSRPVYSGVAEFSIYVDEGARGQGIGQLLLQALIDESERNGIWTLQSGVFPENAVSLRLCERAGFRIVGTREKIGAMHGRWRDVILLERRSRSLSEKL